MPQKNDLPEVDEKFEKALTTFPELKQKLLQQIGTASRPLVVEKLRLKVNDQHNMLAHAQKWQVGSKHGYVSLHANYKAGRSVPPRDPSKRNYPYPVTTYLNNGFINARAAHGAVKARMFYQEATPQVKNAVNTAVQQFKQKLVEQWK
jgi:hypothetical protein